MFPDAISVIGAPEAGDGLVMEYFDSRGVRRTYGIRRYRCAWHREERARKRLAKAGYRSNAEQLVRLLQRRTATGRVPCDVLTDPFAYLTFRLALREETARTGLADLVALERTLNADADLIWRELHEWHKPRTIGAVEEALDRVSHLLGDLARLFGNLPRLNELLKPIQLYLLRLDDPNDYARILRENHLAHAGAPPPRRRHDGAGLGR